MRDDAVLGRALPLDRGLGPIADKQDCKCVAGILSLSVVYNLVSSAINIDEWICSISSFVLCSVHGTFIIHLQFQMPQVVEYLLSVESTFRFYTTQSSKQMLSSYNSSGEETYGG